MGAEEPGEGGACMYYGEEGEEEEEEGREREGRRDRLRALIPLRRRGDAGEVDGAETYRGINQPGTLNKCGEACAHAHRRGWKWVMPQWVKQRYVDLT